MLNSEAIEYVKKPTEEFIRDSWRLVKRCTKPDRQGARMQSRGASTPAEAEAIQQPTGRQASSEQPTSSQRAASDSWPSSAAAAAAHRPTLPAFAMHGCSSNDQLGFACSAAVSGLVDGAPSLCGCLSSLRLSRACRRVLEDCTGDYDWLRDHGLHRLFREADLYPDQQHRMLRTIAAQRRA